MRARQAVSEGNKRLVAVTYLLPKSPGFVSTMWRGVRQDHTTLAPPTAGIVELGDGIRAG